MIIMQFAASAGLTSELIEWYSHGGFCHVDSVLEDGTLLGARLDGGVAIRQPGYEPFLRTLRVELPAPAAITTAYYAFVRAQVGKPYDAEGLVANFVAGRDWRNPDRWFCSELNAAGLEECGYFQAPLATPANRLTPLDLLLALSAVVEIKEAA